MTTPKKRERDLFHRLKYIGYCQSQLPPEDAGHTYGDFVRYAKWKLCEARKILFKDPIWASYHDTEILVEYYALQFERSKETREAFEALLNTGTDGYQEMLDWAEIEKVKNQEAIEAYKAKLAADKAKGELPKPEIPEEEEFEFTPPKEK